MTRSDLLPPLSTARKARQMIGQQQALEQLQASMFAPDNRFRVVFIRAEGGMGKTRLLEEALQLAAAQPDASGPIVSDLIDVIDIRLHARDRFVHELRVSLDRSEDAHDSFFRYDRAFDDLRISKASGGQLPIITEKAQTALDVFMEDLKAITARRRVVWVIDTVEQLRFVTSEWLLNNHLLQADDLRGRTHQWLIQLIQASDLHNVTILLAGRGGKEEGKPFFDRMEAAVQEVQAQGTVRDVVNINLKSLNPEETRQYFAVLAAEWEEIAAAKTGDEQVVRQQVARQFSAIADPTGDRARVLHLYTGGVPVRLALYAQLIVEGRRIPEPLRWSFAKVVSEVGTDDPANDTPALQRRQWEIEDGFINLLFQNPTDLRSRVMQILVRTPRGVSAEQLHYVLDSPLKQDPAGWRSKPERLRELVNLLQEMEDYYLVKRRASWAELTLALLQDVKEASVQRLGLQDEIYRIYAEHMAPHADPRHERVTAIWETLPAAEQERYRRNRQDEQIERQELYVKLRDWAAFQHQQYLERKREYLEEDEKQLEQQFDPDALRTFRFKDLSEVEVDRREAIAEAIRTFEVERIVYDLMLDPERNLNADYVDFGNDINKAHQEEDDFWAQAEMWRIVHDDNGLKFVDFYTRQQTEEWGETAVQVLQRAVIQEDVSRWLKRFVLRGELRRAIEFAQAVNAIIAGMPHETRIEKRIWHSWNHTLVAAERQIWTDYARIMAASEQRRAIISLQREIDRLITLLSYTVDEAAIKREDGHQENGFQASKSKHAHPALIRLRHLVSHAYNILGYGCITLGQVQEAVQYYGQALDIIREDVGTMKVHRGYVLNNLSRALSSLGYDSISVCLDGLQLRRELADEVPLAYSYNTLALIYDNMGRYDDAPKLAAKAIAYFRRAGYPRGLGLALIQMGESLRHLAVRTQSGEMVSATPDSLYTTADTLLREARLIFIEHLEPARLIQINVELGSLYRDRLRQAMATPNQLQKYRSGYYREAMGYLTEARKMAQAHDLINDEVDASINIGWAQFFDGRYAEAEQTTQATIALMRQHLGETYFITETYLPEPSSGELKDLSWAMFNLSKLQVTLGRLALAQFRERAGALAKQYPDRRERHQKIHEDSMARQYLHKAAAAYLLALAYAKLFSPQSRAIAIVLDDLYSRMKKSNHQELKDLHEAVYTLRERYPQLEVTVDELDAFLHAFFGIPNNHGKG